MVLRRKFEITQKSGQTNVLTVASSPNQFFYVMSIVLFPLVLPLSYFGLFPALNHYHYSFYHNGTVTRRTRRHLVCCEGNDYIGKERRYTMDLAKPTACLVVQDQDVFRIAVHLAKDRKLYLTNYINAVNKKNTIKTAKLINSFFAGIQSQLQQETGIPPRVDPGFENSGNCRFCNGEIGNDGFCVSCGAQM